VTTYRSIHLAFRSAHLPNCLIRDPLVIVHIPMVFLGPDKAPSPLSSSPENLKFKWYFLVNFWLVLGHSTFKSLGNIVAGQVFWISDFNDARGSVEYCRVIERYLKICFVDFWINLIQWSFTSFLGAFLVRTLSF
jgi:hypothetical protein